MNSSPSSRRIASHYLFTGTTLVERPLVEVASDGRILSVGSCARPDREACVEFYPGVLSPGLVNVHCHLELSCLRGAIPEGGGFAAFARSMGEVRGRFTERERTLAIEAADARMRAAGIEAVGDVANGASAFAAKARSGMKYRTFAEVFGLRTVSADGQRDLLRHSLTSLTPHSLYSVQDALFRAIAAEGDAPLSLHFLETPAEKELFERRGGLWEWYRRVGFDCDFLGYGSPARRLVESVPRDRSVVLVHGCCTTQRDIDIVMEHFTAPVWWCLCPGSNRYISRLRPPVELLRRNGLNICLGTDSLASNTELSLLEEMKHFAEIPLTELLAWAAPNGAQALGFGGLGEVSVGKRPGLVVISGLDYRTMTLTPAARIDRIV